MYTITLQIIEDEDGTPQMLHNERTPKGWDRAHGWDPGYYATDANCGETGNADAWHGPYKTEDMAIAATNTILNPTGIKQDVKP